MQAAAEGIVSIVATLFLSCGIGSNGRGQADVSGVTGKAIFETPPCLPSSTPMLFSQQMIRAKVSQRVKSDPFRPFRRCPLYPRKRTFITAVRAGAIITRSVN